MGRAVDFQFLETFAAGDQAVVDDVLRLFLEQAKIWEIGLATPGDGFRDLAHTIKGTGRGVGAARLGDLASEAEHDVARAPEVLAELQEAVREVEAYLSTSRE